MLNALWLSFFLLAYLSGLYQWLVLGHSEIFAELMKTTFEQAKTSLDVSLGLVGMMCLWLGLFRIGERAGLVQSLARGLQPLFSRLMPDLPRGHPAQGSITMNMAANMLGMDNAATPVGLKAMREMQELNPKPDTATNPQILFLVINTASVTLLPVTVFMYRAQLGSTDPTKVFVPILITTAISAIAGLLSVAWFQKLPIFSATVLAYIGGILALVGGLGVYFSRLPAAEQSAQSSFLGNFVIFSVIVAFLLAGWRKKIPVYETFIEGAKEGFDIAIRIIPYLVAMLVAVGVFRASGMLDWVLGGVEQVALWMGWDTQFVKALPTGIMKTFSGSGARAMMIDTMKEYGPDSLPGLMACVIQGSTETTFYVLAVYFGSVGVTKIRHALICGLFADLVGVTAAILVSYWFFGG